METLLDTDLDLYRAYLLADYLKTPLTPVMKMSLEEFEGWFAFLRKKPKNG